MLEYIFLILLYPIWAWDNLSITICKQICGSRPYVHKDAQNCTTCENHDVNLFYSLWRLEYVFMVLEYAIGVLDNIFITICAKIYTSTPFAHKDAQNCTTCANIHVSLIYAFLNAWVCIYDDVLCCWSFG